ncbi:MAG: hypothetical protein RL349_12 [Bacteroidota bacterium]|jgi:uncharacterized membrane protein YbhN (UPF0104 family)
MKAQRKINELSMRLHGRIKNYFFFLWRFFLSLFLRLCVAILCLFLFLPLGIMRRCYMFSTLLQKKCTPDKGVQR